MADATTAARDRIDRALAQLESRVLELKAQAGEPRLPDDDLFAIPAASSQAERRRIAELESAGRDASAALGAAAQAVRDILAREAD